MKFGSLFAGVGGFDLGFEAAGMECCFQVEWDPHCQQVLAYHWPDVPRWSDVSDVKGAELPPVDVITFGSPCQDLSVAGKRAGLDGGRSNLFFEATRIIKEMRDGTDGIFPRVAVWENVPGAFSSNEGHDFGSVLDGLAESGALGIEWAVLDARWFGVPQRRRRIFVIAEFDPARAFRGGEPLLAIGKGSAGDYQKVSQQWLKNTDQIDVGVTENPMIAFSHTSAIDLQCSEYLFPTLKTIRNVAIFTNLSDGEKEGDLRKLTEVECERLMGWPDNHTLFRADGGITSSTQRLKMCGNGVASPVAQWVAEQIMAAEPPK